MFTLAVMTLEQAREAAEASCPRQQAVFDELQAAGLALPPLPAPVPIVPPADSHPWPFDEWQVAVLRRREWTADPAELPEEWFATSRLKARGPGQVPPGTVHSRCVTLGLMFMGSTGGRLLVAPGAMPFSLFVTEGDAAIDAFARQCEAVDLDAYLAYR